MNQNIFEGEWKEIHVQVKEWWGKLTDDDLENAGGKADQIVPYNPAIVLSPGNPSSNQTAYCDAFETPRHYT